MAEQAPDAVNDRVRPSRLVSAKVTASPGAARSNGVGSDAALRRGVTAHCSGGAGSTGPRRDADWWLLAVSLFWDR